MVPVPAGLTLVSTAGSPTCCGLATVRAGPAGIATIPVLVLVDLESRVLHRDLKAENVLLLGDS